MEQEYLLLRVLPLGRGCVLEGLFSVHQESGLGSEAILGGTAFQLRGDRSLATRGGKASSRGGNSAVLSQWLQLSPETLSIPSGAEVRGLDLPSLVPGRTFPPPANPVFQPRLLSSGDLFSGRG